MGNNEWGASGGLPPTSPLCFPFSSFSCFPRAGKDMKEGEEMPLDSRAVLELLLKKDLSPQTPSYYVLLCCHLLKSLNSNAASFSVWRLPVEAHVPSELSTNSHNLFDGFMLSCLTSLASLETFIIVWKCIASWSLGLCNHREKICAGWTGAQPNGFHLPHEEVARGNGMENICSPWALLALGPRKGCLSLTSRLMKGFLLKTNYRGKGWADGYPKYLPGSVGIKDLLV